MRVLLVTPPFLSSGPVAPPLALLTLAAWLHRAGHAVRILDLDLARMQGTARTPEECRRLLLDAARDFDPRVVGATSMYNNSLLALDLLRAVKERHPGVATVVGGPHFGAVPALTLAEEPSVDFAVRGEGEVALAALADALERGLPLEGVPNLSYRLDGAVRENPQAPLLDLRELPSPWELPESVLDVRRYLAADAGPPTLWIEAGRGCPFACTFCAPAVFWGRRYRVRPVETVVGEMERLWRDHALPRFNLVHDLLSADRRYLRSLAGAVEESGLPVEWMANSRIDIDLEAMLPELRRGGCWKLFFGVETASPRLQAEVNKHLDAEAAVPTVRALEAAGIAATCSFVIGLPGEETADLSRTADLAVRLKLAQADLVQFHRLRIFPPAKLAQDDTPADFDLDTLLLEYPLPPPPADHLERVRANPAFFSGYFAPRSGAGTGSELAQTELFLTFAIALAPLSVAYLCRVLGERFAAVLYAAFAGLGPLAREALSSDGSTLPADFETVAPYVAEMGRQTPTEYDRAVVAELLRYERCRLRVAAEGVWADPDASLALPGLVVYHAQVDVAAITEALLLGTELPEPSDGPVRVAVAASDTRELRLISWTETATI